MALIPQRYLSLSNKECIECGFCLHYIDCCLKTDGCIGCGACVVACPQSARTLQAIEPGTAADENKSDVLIDCMIDGVAHQIAGPLSVSAALEQLGIGHEIDASHRKAHHAACQTGGCWDCAVLIDGELTRSCITPLRSGMQIVSNPRAISQAVPKRVVTMMRPAPHRHPSVFTHGCNYRCDLCHNWDLTFSSTANALTPAQTVAQLALRPEKDTWIGISGGEPTLNRQWLVKTIREIRRVAPQSRIQLDTNASMLTPDYIDELVEAGITDLSPDFKALRLETFSKITGIYSKDEAQQYIQTVWRAICYTHVNYVDSVFMVVNIPCHPLIHSKSELEEMAVALAALGPEIPVSLTELQPAFRSRHYPRLNRHIMETAAGFLEAKGLKRIIIQGGEGIPRAVDPNELMDSTEDF
jgi:pyruvate formate lyase activating enzyme